MPEIVSCPQCQAKLKVPETLLGKAVKCPTCATTFTAQGGAAPRPQPSVQAEPPREAPPRRPEYADRGDYDDRGSRRSNLTPHRGTLILVLGILSFFVAGPILGPIAWIMGNNDLKAIRAGRMDPEGESNTNTGRICGMIATILSITALVCVCGFYIVFIMMMVGAGASGGGY